MSTSFGIKTVFSQTVNGLPSGTVGLYSNDNDGGVIYDNFCVYIAAIICLETKPVYKSLYFLPN